MSDKTNNKSDTPDPVKTTATTIDTSPPNQVPFNFDFTIDSLPQKKGNGIIHKVKGYESVNATIQARGGYKQIDCLPHLKVKLIYIGSDNYSNDCKSLYCTLGALHSPHQPYSPQPGYPQPQQPPGYPQPQQPPYNPSAPHNPQQQPYNPYAPHNPQYQTSIGTATPGTMMAGSMTAGGLLIDLRDAIFLYNESLIKWLGQVSTFSFYNELEEDANVELIVGYEV